MPLLTATDALPLTGLVNNAGLTAHLGDVADNPCCGHPARGRGQPRRSVAVRPARRPGDVHNPRRTRRGHCQPLPRRRHTRLTARVRALRRSQGRVEALTAGLAKELADQGVRVNAVAPGMVRTTTTIDAAAGDPDRLQLVLPRIPMDRAGEPAEIAPAVAWLLGSESAYVTGATIRVVGGL